ERADGAVGPAGLRGERLLDGGGGGGFEVPDGLDDGPLGLGKFDRLFRHKRFSGCDGGQYLYKRRAVNREIYNCRERRVNGPRGNASQASGPRPRSCPDLQTARSRGGGARALWRTRQSRRDPTAPAYGLTNQWVPDAISRHENEMACLPFALRCVASRHRLPRDGRRLEPRRGSVPAGHDRVPL